MRSVRPGWPRALSARRLVLLATVAGFGVAGATIGTNALYQVGLPTYAAANAAEIAQRPAGFADLVEKVKPAVISVRVKVKAGSEMMSFDGDTPFPKNSPMERVETHVLGAGLHLDPHRYDGRFDLFNEAGKAGGALCDFGGVGRGVRPRAGLMERVGANSGASHTEASNGCKEDKATS